MLVVIYVDVQRRSKGFVRVSKYLLYMRVWDLYSNTSTSWNITKIVVSLSLSHVKNVDIVNNIKLITKWVLLQTLTKTAETIVISLTQFTTV